MNIQNGSLHISLHRKVGRLLIGLLAIVQRQIDRFYAFRHPGVVERALIRLAAPAVQLMAANDKWSLPVHASYWMRAVSAPSVRPLPHPRRIFMLCAYRGQFSLDLTLAALLAWRGHHVTFGYLPKLRSPVKQPLVDHSSAPAYLGASLASVARASRGRVIPVDLSCFADKDTMIDESYLAQQAKSDSVMHLLRESLDPAVPEHRISMDYYRALGVQTQQIAFGYLAPRRHEFDLALIANGTTFESAHAGFVASRLGIPLVCYEKFAFRNIRVMSHGGNFRAFDDLELLWHRRKELGYSEAHFRYFAAERASRLMDERRHSSISTWAWALQRAPTQSGEACLADVGIDPLRPFVLICTNVPYDVGFDKLIRIFPSMRDWLVETVRFLIANTDLQIVVRAHPAEASYWGGKERSEENLAAAGIKPDHRLIIIPGEKTTNTYGLMEACKFGVVFSSTTGLEMAMMGKKVAAGADVYYGRRGFTLDAENRTDYFTKLRALAEEKGLPALSEEQTTDARLFHFMLHFVLQWPYPWEKGGSARDLPPHHLVRSEQMLRYLPTLDALATPPAEFRARLGDFLSVANCRHIPRPAEPAVTAATKPQRAVNT